MSTDTAVTASSGPRPRPLASALHRLGVWCADHPRRIAAAWAGFVVVLVGLVMVAGGALRDDMSSPDAPSSVAAERLSAHLPSAGYATAHVAIDGADESTPAQLETVTAQIASSDDVLSAELRTSAEGPIALIEVRYDAPLADLDAAALTAALDEASQPLRADGATVGIGGQVPESIQGPNGVAEAIGAAVAFVILLLVLRSLLLAFLPFVVALVGVGCGTALIFLLARVVDVSLVTPTLAAMIGIGVSIDYSLLIITRYRRTLADGLGRREAAGEAVGAAGHAVVAAAVIVIIGLSGLLWSGVPGFAWMGVASALAVMTCSAAAITLLPAMLAATGERARPSGRTTSAGRGDRFREAVVRRPVAALAVGIGALVLLALPAVDVRLAQNDAGSEAPGNPTRVAYDIVETGYGAGSNGPLIVVAEPDLIEDVGAAVHATPGISSVSNPIVSEDGAIAVLTAIPQWGPGDERTQELVMDLQRSLPEGAALTGATAAMLDLTAQLGSNLWRVVLGIMLPTALVMLLMVRSLLIPLKAVAANLLSVLAAFGVVTLLFQTEVGARFIGLSEPAPIAAWAPVVLFAITFGLSMDYEVFLVSSIRERYDAHGDNRRAVLEGLGSSTRVITVGAAIMIAVAAGFAADASVMVKLIGVGLVAALVLDVTIVRMLVVPAAMTLLGRWNWWMPKVTERRAAVRHG
ncbi:MMPL family transporter [Blastococcus sp. Marseille-P5729]|uniref:MMPL family transporter n=1 Tax=Blastococcus sp. Marseille-P5729 TaxID=2086582 RepID=UPI000D0E96A7|nr:MMPL family transporter [Blastococcus sp. Marseille-P5729]